MHLVREEGGMLQLKQRRGAFVVITGVMFTALVVCGAVAIDFGRLWTERWELQSAADAGALAGAMQFMPGWDTLTYSDSANAYVTRNRAMTDSITVDSVIKGNWDFATRTWTAGGDPTNAVHVVVSQAPRRLFMQGFGLTVPRMKARATAWAGAPVASTTACMKPWAIPYEELMYRINLHRAATEPNFPYVPANSTANMTRPFDQVADLAALQAMSSTDRMFSLKLSSQSPSGAYDPSTTGNYQAVQLGKYWDYATQTYANPGPVSGGNAYEANVSGANCHSLAVGDLLISEQGVMVGPTLDGMCTNGNITGIQACDNPSVCSYIDANAGTNYGACLDAGMNPGVEVKAAFFSCNTACNGSSIYEVKLLGSFTLHKVYPDKDQGPTPAYDKAQIVGEFKPVQAPGGAGGGSTTLVKLILVQ